MKKQIICVSVLIMAITAGPAFAANYIVDYLEGGNPGGWGTSLKTFDDTIKALPGETLLVDIWARGAGLPNPVTGGFWIDFTADTEKLQITDLKLYNNNTGEPAGPWTPSGTPIIGPSGALADGSAIALMLNLGGASLDDEDNIIIARVEFVCESSGVASIMVADIPDSATWTPSPWDDDSIIADLFHINITTETCNGADDDLDGSTDENCVEICNGIDDDENGLTDENLGQATCGTGPCMITVNNCSGGRPQTCVPVTPVTETCNTFDDDCDGFTDEDCTEACNGLDDDEDGSTDEGFGLTTCGTGSCKVTVNNCSGGEPQICSPGNPGIEICGDNIDQDCDGSDLPCNQLTTLLGNEESPDGGCLINSIIH